MKQLKTEKTTHLQFVSIMIGLMILTCSTLNVLAYTDPDTQQLTTSNPLESAMKKASSGVDSNSEWETLYPEGFVQEFNGMEMMLVPTGQFLMGTSTELIDFAVTELGALLDWFDDEHPEHLQVIDKPFWISKHEVTNTEFVMFLNNNPNGNTSPDGHTYLNVRERYGKIVYLNDVDRWLFAHAFKNNPVIGVSWFGARDYCNWLGEGFRLPTEKEWEYAARGPSNLYFPWGNEWNDDYVIWYGNAGQKNQTIDIARRPVENASWVGANDMSGNVWEWVSSLSKDYPYDASHEDATDIYQTRILRGGSIISTNQVALLASNRKDENPSKPVMSYVGFRCAHD